MKSNHTTIRKALLLVVPAVLLAFVLQSVGAVAESSATVYYKTDGNGKVAGIEKEDVVVPTWTYELYDFSGSVSTVMISGTTVEPNQGYVIDYWTADKTIYRAIDNSSLLMKPIEKGTHLDALSYEVKTLDGGSSGYGSQYYYVTEDTTFTAHFKSTEPHTVTYKAASNGYIPDGQNTEKVVDGSSPVSVPTPVAKDPNKYVFDCWSADKDVTLTNDTVIPADNSITSDQIAKVKVTSNITFTAYFRISVANVTYETDGNGTVDPTSDRIALDAVSCRGAVDADSITLSPNPGFRLAYWTANKHVYIKLDENTWAEIEASNRLDDLTGIYVADDTIFTANLERYAYAITYKTAGGGTVSPETELVELGDYPVGCTITPNKGYEFDYWTANVALEIDDGNNTDPQAEGATIIKAGDPITDEQLKLALLNDDVILTAHFKQTSVDPEPEPVNPDGGDTIKPADTGKLTPKTGDTLPGATAAVALGAGVAVAGAALLKKRHQ